ncbi:MAG: aldo/keto reductase [Actinobacteria bacterium HGW-Actinobacteria-5]|jgi:aryl-alcohol dehydrogenase-like predicted oxidoreductase|nr:MAG: aldo/keto reductase [Actinobacteria bacterium HGW-Actinobacteria-5]
MEQRRLGRIGHPTSVLVYGAAALGEVTQDVADASLQQALDAGINHLDTAASYGHAELVMGPTVERVRDQVFLATKSTQRRAEDAWRELNRSLELLRTDHIDLWQVHAVCSLAELDEVFAPGGAIEAFVRAKDEGIASWIGITGHTEQAPVVHAEALRRHDFDSVLTPVNYHLYTADAEFRANFDVLYALVQERDVALRTIKAIARKPWVGEHRLATWYEPFTEAEDIRAALSWVLGTFPGIAGLATAGETTLLGKAIAAEADRMDVAEAAGHLARVSDYQTIFV